MKITSTEFQQDAARYQDAAQQAPVVIAKDGRSYTVLMSATLFEVLIKGRIARPVEELDDATVLAIAQSVVPLEYASLDDVVRDWPSEHKDMAQ